MPKRYFSKHGDTFGTRLFGEHLVMTRDPLWISELLVRNAQAFDKDKTTKGLSALLGEGLLTGDGEAWRERRRTLQPHFQPAELERYLDAFRAETETEIARWPSSGAIDVHRAITRLTMRVALRTLFGANPDDVQDFEDIMAASMRYFEGVAGTQTTLPTWIPTPVNRRFVTARAKLKARLQAIITTSKAARQSDTLLAQLLDERDAGRITDAQLVDEAITMLVAGHETSALTITYTLHLLAGHPKAQAAAHEEVAQKGVPISMAQLREAGMLKDCLTESLRLYPVAWAYGREARFDTSIDGHFIRKGTQLYIHQWQAQRHPDYIAQAEQFLPERWTSEFQQSLPKSLYAPFGAGPRICIGQHFALAEMRLILSRLLEDFEFSLHTEEPLSFRTSITARPRAPVLLQLERRRSKN